MKCWCKGLFVLIALACLSGCATYSDRARRAIDAWSSGAVDSAAMEFVKRADRSKGSKDELIWLLEAGAVLRAQGDFTNSQRYFDRAVELLRRYDSMADVLVGRETLAVFSNQENLPYRGRWCDRIMLHTYRALNWLALGDIERARPELIRAYQYQQEAVRENARRIEQAREALKSDPNSDSIERTASDPIFRQKVDSLCPINEDFRLLADYVNPFTVYLDGLYFMYTAGSGSDIERARKSFTRVAQIVKDPSLIQADLEQLDRIARGDQPLPTTYVIFETGQGPMLVQERIDIPIIITDVSYVGAAFPRMVTRGDYVKELLVECDGYRTRTTKVGSLDAVFAKEFKDEIDILVAKTLLGSVAKASAAFFVNRYARERSEGLGVLSRLATMAIQMALNIADTRCWTTLPKEFQVARLPTPPDRKIMIRAEGHPQMVVNLLDGTINVVYVKSIGRGVPIRVHQFILR